MFARFEKIHCPRCGTDTKHIVVRENATSELAQCEKCLQIVTLRTTPATAAADQLPVPDYARSVGAAKT